MRPNWAKVTLACLTFILAGGEVGVVHANAPRRTSVAEMVSASDVVFTGVVVDTGVVQSGPRQAAQFAEVQPEKTVTDRAATIKVITAWEEPEADLGPLVRGKRYLFFLTRAPDGVYEATAGTASAIPLDELVGPK